MGAPKKLEEIDIGAVMDMITGGASQKEMAENFEVSVPTMARKIAKLQEDSGLLMQYRTLQSLELTQLQNKILNAVTPEKIEEAPLRDLVLAFKILKDKELVSDGKPTEIKGLVEYLIHMEKEDAGLNSTNYVDAEVVDEMTGVEKGEELSPDHPDFVPSL